MDGTHYSSISSMQLLVLAMGETCHCGRHSCVFVLLSFFLNIVVIYLLGTKCLAACTVWEDVREGGKAGGKERDGML